MLALSIHTYLYMPTKLTVNTFHKMTIITCGGRRNCEFKGSRSGFQFKLHHLFTI